MEKEKRIKYSLILVMGGILINMIMVYLVGRISLPLYIDSTGTILAAVLGGTLPGITVGFFSNLINYLLAVSPDPLTLYYGLVSVLLAVVAVYFAKRGLYKKWGISIAAVFAMAFVGGGIGSVLTWILYGFSFGDNVSRQIVMPIYELLQCPPFAAQLLGDYLVDVLDKAVTVVLAYCILKLIPERSLARFSYGYHYLKDGQYGDRVKTEKIKCRRMSLKKKLTMLLVFFSMLLGLVATLIGMYSHYRNTVRYYEDSCQSMASTVADFLDGDQMDTYAEMLFPTDDYRKLCAILSSAEENNENIDLISVFRVMDGKNRVLFNLGNEDTQNEVSYIVWPQSVQECIDQMESGTGQDGYLIRVEAGASVMALKPVRDSSGKIAAYAAVQMKLAALKKELNVFFIQIFSLLFGIGIILVAYVYWFCENSILEPIRILILQTKEVAEEKKDQGLLRDKMQVKTGDELEILFQDMCDAEDCLIRSDSASRSKTKFLSKMSHEIRTPLNSVIGFSNLAINDRASITKEELLDYMQKIQISGNYLLELVSDVLDISRIEEGRMTVTNEACRLDDLVEEVVNSFQGQMKGKKIEFVVDKDYGDYLIYMDSFHTTQILNNLISNACKYTEEGGVVGFEIHAKPLPDKKIQLQFIVQDTGIGMSEEFQKKIFEPFTQDQRGMKMKKQLRGSGLGMSICKNLIDLLGGTITLQSKEGEGSCFTVTITYEMIGKNNEAGQNANTDYSVLRGKKILVVDDLELNRIVVEKFLAVYGLQFEDAEDGTEAVDKYLASEPGEYFAVFMDVQMTEMNGYDATRTIRASDRPDHLLPIIGMTADAFADDVEKAKRSGMDYHVTKPIKVEKLLGILMEIAARPSVDNR